MANKRKQKQFKTNRKVLGVNTRFSLLNSVYFQKFEFMENVTIYKKPVYGEIKVSTQINFDYLSYYIFTLLNCFRFTMFNNNNIGRWQGYFNIKNSGAQNCIELSTKMLSHACLTMILLAMRAENVESYLLNLGFSNVKVPIWIYEAMKLSRSFQQTHRIDGIENSMLTFIHKDLTVINFDDEWTEGKPDQKQIDELNKNYNSDSAVIKSIYRLECLCQLILPESHVKTLNDFNNYTDKSQTLFSCYVLNKDEKDDKSATKITKFKIGRDVTTQAIIWAKILGISYDYSEVENSEEIFSGINIELKDKIIKNSILLMNNKLYGNDQVQPIIDQVSNTEFEAIEPAID